MHWTLSILIELLNIYATCTRTSTIYSRTNPCTSHRKLHVVLQQDGTWSLAGELVPHSTTPHHTSYCRSPEQESHVQVLECTLEQAVHVQALEWTAVAHAVHVHVFGWKETAEHPGHVQPALCALVTTGETAVFCRTKVVLGEKAIFNMDYA